MLRNGRTWTAVGCVMLIALGAVGLLLCTPGYRPSDRLLRQWETELPKLSELDVLPQVRRMAALNDAGVAATVRLLGSSREVEAEAATIALREAMDRWRLLPVEKSAPRALHLAQALARQAEQMKAARADAARRNAVGELVTEVLLWPASNAAQAEEILAHCEIALNAISTGQEGTKVASRGAAVENGLPIPDVAAPSRQFVPPLPGASGAEIDEARAPSESIPSESPVAPPAQDASR